MTDSDQAPLADEWASPDAFKFEISVALQDEHDPVRAIQWRVKHIVTGLHFGNLPIRGIGPDGTVYIWFPEGVLNLSSVTHSSQRGKSPGAWLVNTWPQELPVQRRVPIPPGMTTSQARRVLARAAREQPAGGADG